MSGSGRKAVDHGQLREAQNRPDPQLPAIDTAMPKKFEIHLGRAETCDDRPSFHACIFTPTYGLWLNLVERSFPELTNEQLQRGTRRSIPQLEATWRPPSATHRRASREI